MKLKNLIFSIMFLALVKNSFCMACSNESDYDHTLHGKIVIAKDACARNITLKSKFTDIKNHFFGYKLNQITTKNNVLVHTAITISNSFDPNNKDTTQTWITGGWTYLPIDIFQNDDGSFKKENDSIILTIKGIKELPFRVNLKLGKSFNNLKEHYQKFISKNYCNIL